MVPQNNSTRVHDIPIQEIEQLLREIKIPRDEFERIRRKTEEILLLSWDQVGNNMSDSLERDLQLTKDRSEHIPRFADIPMIYRDYVGIHSKRIMLLIGFERPFFKKVFWNEFNDHYLTLYAEIHDILEWLSPFWDVPTPLKLWLSKKSQEIMDTVERKLWEIYIQRVPLAHWEYEYDEAMLEDMITKKTLESQVLSYFDKVDWFLACFHELVAGNKDFLEPFWNYIAIFKDIKSWKKLPNISPLTHKKRDPDSFVDTLCDIDTLLEQENRIHDFFWKCPTTDKMRENIEEDFWLPMYKAWKWIGKQIPAINFGNWCIISWEDMVCLREREVIPLNGLY